MTTAPPDPLAFLHPAARAWFDACFDAPTPAQRLGWPSIEAGESTLLLAPTGSGKTLAAFLSAINRLMFAPTPAPEARCRVLYISPIKALGVDIEQNLRAPLAGIAAMAHHRGLDACTLEVGVRSGDTPPSERARLRRRPPDILITTPESLYLMLTSHARDALRAVETVIVDEIHTLVGTKRGTHLALSLERLGWHRTAPRPLQRIGLSATQRPLEEVARFLGGFDIRGEARTERPITLVDAGRHKDLDLCIEVPVEDMTALEAEPAEGPAQGARTRSIWPAIHPRLIELIRAHRSTMLFVNSRRLAERLAAAINELAAEELALAHHGSMSKDARADIEDRLKRGVLPAIVATSSLELGIDMGAVDLVIQLEAPPTIASGLQRIGRAAHHVGGRSRGVIIPKHRADLLACAAAAAAMLAGHVESTRYPQNPLDVLAQQLVAAIAMDPADVEALYDRIRAAAPYVDLPRDAFEGLLDMLSGRYPSDDFQTLRPRVIYDRITGRLTPHQGAHRVAITNAGTIPDRGLYGVFLASSADSGKSRRVGELDEEMVFESRVGDVFLLGASSWRIEEITHDRVIVTPAPGEPGKMPFWRGDGPGRPLEFGQAIGQLTRELAAMAPRAAEIKLRRDHCLDGNAARNLVAYLTAQREAGALPTDRTLVVERFRDEIGDWRICILSPFGAAVHAPWAMAVRARLLEHHPTEIDVIWNDDGLVFRLPETDTPPETALFFPPALDLEDHVVARLAETSLFAARFRENAGRALLLPKKRPGQRTPLWALRRKAADLLAAAARYRDFPIVLETYREVLKDVFDLPGAIDLMRRVESRQIHVAEIDSKTPTPFAAALLFNYVARFMYEGDAPLAERRAAALTIDHARLKALLGEAALRDLLDPDAIDELEALLQRRKRPLGHPDDIHDLLLALGDQSQEALADRLDPAPDPASPPDPLTPWLDELLRHRRIVRVKIGGHPRYIAAEDAARYRDALGVVSPPGLPAAFLEAVQDPLADLVARHARTHGPFRAEWVATRYGVGVELIRGALTRLADRGKVVEGEFIPRGQGLEWCDDEVLRRLKRMSLARLRQEVEPVEQDALARFLLEWQGIGDDGEGPEALLQVIEQLQGAPIAASTLEAEVLPARLGRYRPADLDLLCATGDVTWRGLRPLGQTDGYVALYLTADYALLAPEPSPAASAIDAPAIEGAIAPATAPAIEPAIAPTPTELTTRIRDHLATRGASFFQDITHALGAFPTDVLEALWDLVWTGEVGNDTLTALRSRLAGATRTTPDARRRGRAAAIHNRGFRPRRHGPPGSEGRWSLLPALADSPTDRRAALTTQLLERHGVLTREATTAEETPGGFSALYPVLKHLEESGRIRRGYFTAGLGATQFALPGADDRLRDAREPPTESFTALLAATDPANPYGAALPWPPLPEARFERAAGSRVILHNGRLIAFLSRSGRQLYTHLPDTEPDRTEAITALTTTLAQLLDLPATKAILIEQIDTRPAATHAIAKPLTDQGFRPTHEGLLLRRGEPRTHFRPRR